MQRNEINYRVLIYTVTESYRTVGYRRSDVEGSVYEES